MKVLYNMWSNIRNKLKVMFMGKDYFLCDDCRYDYPGACSNPERPNAKQCPDYKRR